MHRIRDELRRARLPALALFTAFLLGAILIVLTDFEHLRLLGTDPVAAIGGAFAGVFDGYPAMFSGAIGDPALIVAARAVAVFPVSSSGRSGVRTERSFWCAPRRPPPAADSGGSDHRARHRTSRAP